MPKSASERNQAEQLRQAHMSSQIDAAADMAPGLMASMIAGEEIGAMLTAAGQPSSPEAVVSRLQRRFREAAEREAMERKRLVPSMERYVRQEEARALKVLEESRRAEENRPLQLRTYIQHNR
jgi:hypothetical protein